MIVADADRLCADFFAIPVSFVGLLGLHQRALEIAGEFGLPAAYDAHYLALAEVLGCDVWTDDQRLLRALDGALPFVRWIGDYQASDTT